MKRNRERFVKISENGEIIYEDIIEINVDDDLDVDQQTARRMFRCPTCGQVQEQNIFRTSCPLCGGICCDFCHNEMIKAQKVYFEQELQTIKQRQALLESKLFDKMPFKNVWRYLFGIGMKNRLEDLRWRR